MLSRLILPSWIISSSSLSLTFFLIRLGTSMPTVDFPGSGATTLTLGAFKAIARSSESDAILDTLVPGDSSSSYMVIEGPVSKPTTSATTLNCASASSRTSALFFRDSSSSALPGSERSSRRSMGSKSGPASAGVYSGGFSSASDFLRRFSLKAGLGPLLFLIRLNRETTASTGLTLNRRMPEVRKPKVRKTQVPTRPRLSRSLPDAASPNTPPAHAIAPILGKMSSTRANAREMEVMSIIPPTAFIQRSSTLPRSNSITPHAPMSIVSGKAARPSHESP